MYNNWSDLEKACLQCEKCGLCSGRHNVVFGVGNRRSKVMFVGEGPGENEDLQGEPFVGRGGQLLDKYLAAVDLDRKTNVYIGNIVKCRPPKNRDPLPEEQEACIDWLRNQFALIRPKIVVCLGRVAGHQDHQGARRVYRQKRYADDGDAAPRRSAAQPRPEARRL